MSPPSISIIIPCYNAATWIRETISSVIIQAHPIFEIIVVDDGSTDGSNIIIENNFPQVNLIRVPNGGVSHARNIGAEHAQGEWIQFLDADDVLHPNKLEWQVASLFAQSEKVAFIFSPWCNMTLQNGNWHPIPPVRSTILVNDLYEQIFEHFTPLSTGLIRKTWFDQVGGFDVNKPLIEDVHLQLRFLLAGATIAYIPTPEPVFYYRQIAQSLSHRNTAQFVAECWANLELAEAGLIEKGELTPARRELLARNYLFVARYYANHDRACFEQVVDKMEKLVPGFLPSEPRLLAVTARILGYRRAEQVAGAYRHLKQWFKGAS
jgi:glycosyltransferase involved in cell wall biosynthesis